MGCVRFIRRPPTRKHGKNFILPHRCDLPRPAFPLGTVIECDDCGARWKIVEGSRMHGGEATKLWTPTFPTQLRSMVTGKQPKDILSETVPLSDESEAEKFDDLVEPPHWQRPSVPRSKYGSSPPPPNEQLGGGEHDS